MELLEFSLVSSHAVGSIRMPRRAVNIGRIGPSASMLGDTGYQLLVDDGPHLVGVQYVELGEIGPVIVWDWGKSGEIALHDST